MNDNQRYNKARQVYLNRKSISDEAQLNQAASYFMEIGDLAKVRDLSWQLSQLKNEDPK